MPNPSTTDRTAGDIDWPNWAEQTEPRLRTRTSKFSVAIGQSIKDVATELENRIGVDAWRISTAAPHRKKDGLPYADANPDDPGAVVRWTMDGEQYAISCDEYTDLRDNIRAIGLYITEKRKMSNRPVQTGQDEFATARLPSGDEETAIAAAPPPHEVLGVAPDASEGEVLEAFREKVKDAHTDQGGSDEAVQRLLDAREAMLDG